MTSKVNASPEAEAPGLGARTDRRGSEETPRRRHRWRSGTSAKLAMIAPALAIYLTFYLGPMFASLGMSLFRWSGFENPTFVGIEHYAHLLTSDPTFTHNMYLTVAVAALSLVMIVPLSLILAMALWGSGRLSSAAKWITFLPVVMPLAATALLWLEIYNPHRGQANRLVTLLGFEPVVWLGSESTALWAVLAVMVWSSVGLYAVFLLSYLSAIPADLIEAARLETSSRWRSFRYVILPLLRDGITACAVLVVALAFVYFTSLALLMTRGGPNRSTEVLGLRMYFEAFVGFNFGRANALTVVTLFLALILVGTIMFIGTRKRIEY